MRPSLSRTSSRWTLGCVEVVNRPATGFATRCPEEPCTNSVRTVLREAGRVTAPPTLRAVCQA